MNWKNITGLFLGLIASAQLFAQQPNDEELAPKDPKAKVILDKLSEKNKDLKSAYIEFDYHLQAPDVDETQPGKAWIKGDMYKLKMSNIERYSDGKSVWTVSPDDEEVQVSSATENEDGDDVMKPSEILTIYENGFNYKYDKEGTKDGKKVDIINLFPEVSGKPYHTIKLFVDKSTGQIYAMMMKFKDGNNYTYTIKKLEKNVAVSDGDFLFDTQKAEAEGYDVIDLTE